MTPAFGCRVRLRPTLKTESRNRINPANTRANGPLAFGCAIRLCLYPKRGRGKADRQPKPNEVEGVRSA